MIRIPSRLIFWTLLLSMGASLASCGALSQKTGGSTELAATLDTSLQIGAGFTGTVDRVQIQSKGHLIVAGRMTRYQENTVPYIARLSSTGQLDTNFTIVGGGPNSSVFSVLLNSDDHIFLGGDFSSYGLSPLLKIARLSGTGTLNSSFNSSGSARGFDDQVNVIVFDNLGRLLVGGEFNSYQGVNAIRLARLDPDTGDIDSEFRSQVGALSNTSFNLAVNALHVDTDGGILVGGSFSTFRLNARGRLVRLKNTGEEDTTFTAHLGTGFDGDVQVVLPDSQGGYLVGGAFSKLNGQKVPRLVRLSVTGILDEDFIGKIGTGPNGIPHALVLDSQGRIYVGGDFSSWGSLVAPHLVRLETDGTLDTAFLTAVGTGFDDEVRSLVFQKDGKLVAGGAFQSYQNISSPGLVRLE